MWEVMFWPLVACLLFPWLLVYLGTHVIQRGIIFIDIAMAQLASAGVSLAVLLHLDIESPLTLLIALAFTLAGAAVFSFTGKRESPVPQEAVIGIAYVVAAAAAVLLLSRAAEGDEQIKNMLVGNLLLVTPAEIGRAMLLFLLVGAVHFAFRRPLLRASFDREGAFAAGMRVQRWDFLFYATFGLVITGVVMIAGVLVVFTFLIVPAACGTYLFRSFRSRLLAGWVVAIGGGMAGLCLSYWLDLPSGAAIVCTFGVLFAAVILGTAFGARQKRPLQRASKRIEIS